MKTNKILLSKYLITYGLTALIGFMLGAILVYKVEINTMNQALESLRSCYETYGGFN